MFIFSLAFSATAYSFRWTEKFYCVSPKKNNNKVAAVRPWNGDWVQVATDIGSESNNWEAPYIVVLRESYYDLHAMLLCIFFEIRSSEWENSDNFDPSAFYFGMPEK